MSRADHRAYDDRAYDVAIVGGGPAGSAAAITLARAGRRVVLLERGRGETERFCGEFLSPDGVGTLDELGVLHDVLEGAPTRLDRWSIRAGPHELAGHLPAAALGVRRLRLDATLRRAARAAGAELREGTRVQRLERRSPDGFRLVVHGDGGDPARDGTRDGTPDGADAPDEPNRAVAAVEARRVIVAAGRASCLGRSARGRGPRTAVAAEAGPGADRWIAMKTHCVGRGEPGTVELFALGGAYVGVAPVEPDLVNVCFLARRSAFDAAGRSAEALLSRAAERHVGWSERVASLAPFHGRWLAVARFSFDRTPPAWPPGVLGAGDANGLVAPFLGTGMAVALESGHLAARALHDGFDRPGELARRWEIEWRKRFGSRMRWGRGLQELLLSERAAPFAVRALSHAGWLASVVLARTRTRPRMQRGALALARWGSASAAPHVVPKNHSTQ